MSEQKFDSWGLVELFGHSRVAGRITEQSVGGCNFVRVDIPKGDGFYTRLFGQGAIYAINVTSEDVARKLAARYCEQPAYAWDVENANRRLPAAATDGDIHDDDSPVLNREER